jgi:hypothetical protein
MATINRAMPKNNIYDDDDIIYSDNYESILCGCDDYSFIALQFGLPKVLIIKVNAFAECWISSFVILHMSY